MGTEVELTEGVVRVLGTDTVVVRDRRDGIRDKSDSDVRSGKVWGPRTSPGPWGGDHNG